MAALFRALVLLLAAMGPLSALQPPRSAAEALTGLDPVLLSRGEFRQGEEEISFVHEGYWYRFVSPRTLKTFKADPSRYAIELGGVCARMGGLVEGKPEIFSSHQGRIFIFSSQQCRQLFDSAPERYLPHDEPLPPPDEARSEQALAMLDEVVAAIGGAALNDLNGYRYGSAYRLSTSRGDLLMETQLLVRSDGYFRRVETRPFGPVVMVLAPGGGFTQALGRRRALGPGQRRYLEALVRRQLPLLLRARRSPIFTASVGSTDDVDLSWDGVRSRLRLSPDRRVISLRYQGRGPDGIYGQVEERFSDYRTTGAVTLPYRIDAFWNGQPDIGRSVDVIQWRLEVPPIDEFLGK